MRQRERQASDDSVGLSHLAWRSDSEWFCLGESLCSLNSDIGEWFLEDQPTIGHWWWWQCATSRFRECLPLNTSCRRAMLEGKMRLVYLLSWSPRGISLVWSCQVLCVVLWFFNQEMQGGRFQELCSRQNQNNYYVDDQACQFCVQLRGLMQGYLMQEYQVYLLYMHTLLLSRHSKLINVSKLCSYGGGCQSTHLYIALHSVYLYAGLPLHPRMVSFHPISHL